MSMLVSGDDVLNVLVTGRRIGKEEFWQTIDHCWLFW